MGTQGIPVQDERVASGVSQSVGIFAKITLGYRCDSALFF